MKRYEYIKKIGNGLKTIKFPKIKESEFDTTIIATSSDRLDLLADKFYGNQELYWIIALANNLGYGTLEISAGTILRIPYNFNKIIQEYSRLNS